MVIYLYDVENPERQNLEVTIDDGVIHPIPLLVDPKNEQVDVMYISARQGAGKSTYIADYVADYRKLYPRNKIFLFSSKFDDETNTFTDKAYQHLPYITVMKVDQSFLDIQLNPSDFADSLVIFDDIEQLPYKEVLKEINDLRRRLLTVGREKRIFVIVTSHIMCDGDKTRLFLNEHNKGTFFKGCNMSQVKRYLENYSGVSDKKIQNKIINLPSRWITVSQNYPAYVIYEKGIFLI